MRAPARVRARVPGLVERARQGDPAAFEALWDDHAPLVHAILLSMVREQEAEDLMQETALAAWRRIHRVGRAERFTPWLSAIARNKGRDALRRRVARRREEALDGRDLADASDAPESATGTRSAMDPNESELDAERILQCIRQLPEAYREPLMLRLVLGLPARRIAERTGRSHGSIRVNLCRGMKLLRKALNHRRAAQDRAAGETAS